MVESKERHMVVKLFFQSTFRSLLGQSGSRVLEFHMARILKADPYDVLYEDPKAFCDGLKLFLGAGADALLRVIAGSIVKKYCITNLKPDDLVKLMNEGSEEAREKFLKLIGRLVENTMGRS